MLPNTFPFILFLFSMCLVLPVQIVAIRGVRLLMNIGSGEYVSLLPLIFITVSMVLPFSFIIGVVFPFSAKVVLGSTKDAATDIGAVYIIESLGSLIGGLLFSFYLVSKFHSMQIVVLMNAGMFFVLFLMLRAARKKEGDRRRGISHFLALGLTTGMITLWFSPVPERIDAWSAKMRWNTFAHHIELTASANSKYQHIDVGKQAGQHNVYLNGHYAFAFPNEYDYAQIAHLVMTQHPSPKKVLVIGGGFGGLLTEMLLYPVEGLDYVEIDQELLHIAAKYLSPTEINTRMGVIIALFMVGLACGGYAANKMIQKRNSDWIKVSMMLEGMIAGYAIIVPFLISAISAYSVIAETVLVFLVMVTGILTGIEFPVANKICAQCNDNIAVSAGVTDGADHIGAFFGVDAGRGVLFLPLLGLYGTCLILAALNAASLALLAFLNISRTTRLVS